jgi:mono/diheme cytochrome c family protein
MKDSLSSTEVTSSRKVRPVDDRRGVGCAIAFSAILVGLIVAVVVGRPRLLDLLTVQLSAPTPALDDHTSPEELAARRAEELARLNEYGWVDQEAGVAHIPIERAIALVAESGLPVGGEEEEVAATGTVTGTATEPPIDLSNVNYQDHVLPIFEQHCAECHGAEDPEEGLELTRYRTAMVGSQNGPVIEPGDPENSYLVEQIVEGKMPKRGDPLPQSEIDTIIAWIEAGAPEIGSVPAEETTQDAADSATPEAAAPPVDLANVSFQDHVLPIFEQHCAECHGAEDPEEQLEVTNYRTLMLGSQNGPVIEPGDVENSYLVEQIVEGRMPKRGDPLSQSEIDIIVAWIEAGALDN